MTDKHEFTRMPFQKPTLVQRLLGQQPQENALAELSNLLGDHFHEMVSMAEVREIEEKFAVDFDRDFPEEREQLYAEYLRYVLLDQRIDDDEAADLLYLRSLLSIGDEVGEGLQSLYAEEAIRGLAKLFVGNGKFSEKEKTQLEAARDELRINETEFDRILRDEAESRWNAFFEKAAADYRISDWEEERLHKLAAELGLGSEFQQNKHQLMERLRTTVMPSNRLIHFEMEADESLLYRASALWFRSVHRRKGPDGSGEIYLTNKRFVFWADDEVRMSHVFGALNNAFVYRNGVELETLDGNREFFRIRGSSTEILLAALKRVWKY